MKKSSLYSKTIEESTSLVVNLILLLNCEKIVHCSLSLNLFRYIKKTIVLESESLWISLLYPLGDFE